jgi:hypothetical protein
MDFNSLRFLKFRPAALKLSLHLTPNTHRLLIDLVHLYLRRLLELKQTEFSLDDGRFSHQEFQLLECTECFMPAPCGLDLDSGEDRAVRTFEFEDWVEGLLDNLGFVRNDLHEFFFGYQFVLVIGH